MRVAWSLSIFFTSCCWSVLYFRHCDEEERVRAREGKEACENGACIAACVRREAARETYRLVVCHLAHNLPILVSVLDGAPCLGERREREGREARVRAVETLFAPHSPYLTFTFRYLVRVREVKGLCLLLKLLPCIKVRHPPFVVCVRASVSVSVPDASVARSSPPSFPSRECECVSVEKCRPLPGCTNAPDAACLDVLCVCVCVSRTFASSFSPILFSSPFSLTSRTNACAEDLCVPVAAKGSGQGLGR